jgi:GST-like protein
MTLQRRTTPPGRRPAVTRGRRVNRMQGDPAQQLHERHDASDFHTKTQDKLAAAKGGGGSVLLEARNKANNAFSTKSTSA